MNKKNQMDIKSLEDKKDISGLIEALDNQDWFTKYKAIIALGNLKADSAVPKLSYFLKSDDADLKAAAEQSLSNIDSSEAKELLNQIKSESQQEYYDRFINEKYPLAVRIDSLNHLWDLKHKDVIPLLEEYIDYDDKKLREKAFQLLCKVDQPKHIPLFIKYLQRMYTTDGKNGYYTIDSVDSVLDQIKKHIKDATLEDFKSLLDIPQHGFHYLNRLISLSAAMNNKSAYDALFSKINSNIDHDTLLIEEIETNKIFTWDKYNQVTGKANYHYESPGFSWKQVLSKLENIDKEETAYLSEKTRTMQKKYDAILNSITKYETEKAIQEEKDRERDRQLERLQRIESDRQNITDIVNKLSSVNELSSEDVIALGSAYFDLFILPFLFTATINNYDLGPRKLPGALKVSYEMQFEKDWLGSIANSFSLRFTNNSQTGKQTISALESILLQHQDWTIRYKAAKVLRALKDEASLDCLEEARKDREIDVSHEARDAYFEIVHGNRYVLS